MILTGTEIEKQIENGEISITPFDKNKLNPNSYNISLSNELAVYGSELLDMKKENILFKCKIPEEGFILKPGILYLGRTAEKTFTKTYVPILEGRSSVGRLGIFIHVTAGFGDIGFNGYWTLEITCVQPVKIYPNVEIGQVYFMTPYGDKTYYDSNAKYNNNNGIQGSKLYQDFIKKEDNK